MRHALFSLFATVFFCSFSFAQVGGTLPSKDVSHTFYATGNLGTINNNQNNPVIQALAKAMKKGNSATLLLIGNNASPKGFSKDGSMGKQNLDSYSNALQPFSKNIYFIPGSSDWESGLKGLKAQEDYLEQVYNNKNVFQPEKGCPIKRIKINDDVVLLILDSQWALSNWDKIPSINDDCHIKTKSEFYTEVESQIVKNQGKTVLIAVNHPITAYGKYGNSYSFGINPQNINNKFYKEFSGRLLTIAQQSKNVVFVSGHEQNMQYIVKRKVPVIISGSGGITTQVDAGKYSKFHSNESGFSKIIAYKDGSMWVSFYGASNNFDSPIYVSEVIRPEVAVSLPDYNEESTPAIVSKSIYKPEELKRTAFYKMLWGKHYREDYKTPVAVKSALLDTLYGGLSVIRKGGGHQTNSLRLETKDGKSYAMRSTKKSALRFIQYFLFKTYYLDPEIADTYFIQLLQDYWTTANPYGSLTIGDLSDAINVYHANTKMYYIPKQKALGIYNDDYGDKVYFIEERLTDGHGNVASLGNTNTIVSTSDLFETLRRKDIIEINESRYIRSRLFDNIIGDFDRHEDQWRWAVQEQKNGVP
ncbi:MAG: hypothetical protein JKY22_01255 [Flavobacteriaceae bacterium]|nr:hypothetical protein [Flavobacteriaceae bacterium]